ncbi:MAG TPA: hypothetical protein VK781_10545, partial [Solirubrobacteraceae bacterium]|nr:hypothetical protein [Solirubrobacteraceae bacterium]
MSAPAQIDEQRAESHSAHVGARRATIDVAVQVFARVGNLALGVVVTLVVVRALGTNGFGQWSTIFAVTQIATNFGELGLTQVAVGRAAREPAHQGDWLGALVSLRVMLAIPATIASLIAILLIAPTQETQVAGALIAVTVLLAAPAAVTAAFQLRVRNDISMAIMTLGSILWAAGAIAVSLLSGGI